MCVKCVDVKIIVNRRRPDGLYAKLAEAKARKMKSFVLIVFAEEVKLNL